MFWEYDEDAPSRSSPGRTPRSKDSGRSWRVVRRSSDWYPMFESITHTGSFSWVHFQSLQLSAAWGENSRVSLRCERWRYSSNITSSGESSLRRVCGGVFGGGDDDESASRRDELERDCPLQLLLSSTSSFTTIISSVSSGVSWGVSSADLPFPLARDGLEERRDSDA